jgi:protein O-mannosyl-transferase
LPKIVMLHALTTMKFHLQRVRAFDPQSSSTAFDVVATALILLIVACLYFQVLGHQFVAWDDTSYVSENQRVMLGLDWSNVKWSFGTFQLSNWHPVTLLSHMLDVEIWGLRPGMHAATNVAIHMLNSVLVYFFFCRAVVYMQGGTLSKVPALLFALLFAVHPLHVESVAWISQRKDMLCALFWLLAMHAYLSYARRRSVLGYLLVTVSIALSLLSKPMAVTLPLILWTIDWWQLQRQGGSTWRSLAKLGLEKIPWLLLSAGVAYLTIVAQASAMPAFNSFERIQLAISAYGWYLGKTFLPTDLHFYYLAENAWDVSHFAFALPLLVLVSWLAYHCRTKRPEFLAGWLWYLITLFPVVGFIKVGTQSWADRYVFLIGVSVAVSVAANPQIRKRAIVSMIIFLLGLSWVAWRQISVWANTSTLYQNALLKEPRHYVAMMGLANHSIRIGDYAAARRLAVAALELSKGPSLVRSMQGVLGEVALSSGNLSEAIRHFESGRDAEKSSSEIRLKLGLAYMQAGKLSLAEAEYREVLRQDGSSVDGLNGLGVSLGLQERFDEAMQAMERAVKYAPKRRDIRRNFATLALQSGNLSKARDAYSELILLDPEDHKARAALAGLTNK